MITNGLNCFHHCPKTMIVVRNGLTLNSLCYETHIISKEMNGLVVMSASNLVGHGFTPQLGHTKDHRKNSKLCLPAWHAGIMAGVWQKAG